MAANKKPYHERVAEEILEQLKEGTAPWMKPWEAGQVMDAPVNALTGKPYRGWNSIYLSMQQKGEDNRWCTYKQAKELGAQVRRGEKSTEVQYWKFFDKKPKLDSQGKPVLDSKGNQEYEHVELARPRVFRAYVFHASQIDNMPPMPERKTIPEWERHEKAEAVLQGSGAKIFHDQGDRAFYNSYSDEIHLPPKGQFPSSDNYYATALHELGHWTGHETRLNRDLGHPFGSEGYAKEELRAEMASFMIGTELGIGHDPSQHVAYIGSWIKAVEDDPFELFRAARDAQEISDYVNELVQQHELKKEISNDIGSAEDHDKALAYLEDVAVNKGQDYNPMVTWENIEKEAIFQGLEPKLSMAGEKYQGDVVVHYEKDGEPLNMFTEIAGGDGKALTSVNGDRVPNTFFSEDTDTQKAALRQAVGILQDYHVVERSDAEGHPEGHKMAMIMEYQDKQPVGFHAVGVGENDMEAEQDALNNSKQIRQELKNQQQEQYNEEELNNRLAQHGVADTNEIEKPEFAQEKTYLNVPYKEKDQAKAVGARWDAKAKSWYADKGTNLTPLKKWMPDKEVVQVQEPAKDPMIEFKEALLDAGLQIEGMPKMDGVLHRVKVEGDSGGKQSGAYKGYLDGHPAGYIQNFKTGFKQNWKATGQQLNPAEIARLEKEAKEKRAAREREREEGYKAKAAELRTEYEGLGEAPADHPYLLNKGLNSSFGVKIDDRNNLVIPIENEDGLSSVQRIGGNGFKSFEKGGKTAGGYHVLGGKDALEAQDAHEPVLISTGFGTSASIHMATGKPVVVAFQDNNLQEVAEEFKRNFPERTIAVLGDDDRHLPERTPPLPNSGREKATAAARAVGGKAIFPQFTQNEKGREFADFNDLHRVRGLAAVQRQVEQGLSQARGTVAAKEQQQERQQEQTQKQEKTLAIKKERSRGHSLGL